MSSPSEEMQHIAETRAGIRSNVRIISESIALQERIIAIESRRARPRPIVIPWTEESRRCEYETWTWMIQQNTKGIPVTSSLVAMKHAEHLQLLGALTPVQSRIHENLLRYNNAGRQWLHKWRQRWGAAVGRLACERAIPPHLEARKVAVQKQKEIHSESSFWPKDGYNSGTTFGTHFWPQIVDQKWVHS